MEQEIRNHLCKMILESKSNIATDLSLTSLSPELNSVSYREMELWISTIAREITIPNQSRMTQTVRSLLKK